MFSNLLLQVSVVGADSATVANSLTNILGVNLFEESIDNVVFQTNQFVSDATFIGTNGPFWWLSDITSFGTSKPSVNQLLGSLSRETSALGGTKTGQNRKKSYLTICLVLPSFQTSRLQVQSYEIVPI